MKKQLIMAQYIWTDGRKPTAMLRSKVRVIPTVHSLADIPKWAFDGSSTEQATTSMSDCALRPVYYLPNPILGGRNIIVMCEVYDSDGRPHKSNTRVRLRQVAKAYRSSQPLFGFEQEYTMYDKSGKWPYGWPTQGGYPGPQGPYYCGEGANDVNGRPLVEAHTIACMKAGIRIYGTNAEVMPSQWEFQLGPLGPLEIADQLWLARWLLYRLGEPMSISPRLDPKPIEQGDWNGAGCHVNFSTKQMRASGGLKAIRRACQKLGQFHSQHIIVYGADNERRLTGKYETCDINAFRYGVGDRGASIRIPMLTAKAGRGYLEDRRPAANCDPYLVCTALIETVCGRGFKT